MYSRDQCDSFQLRGLTHLRSNANDTAHWQNKPAPMLAICQLLCLKSVEPVIRESEILEFALLVNKFGCVQALKPATYSMLDQINSSSPYSYDLIVSAFILEQPKHF